MKQEELKKLSDRELAASFRESGRTDCLGILFERYSHLALGVCLNLLQNEEESKDAVLSIFEKLMDDLKKHEVENFKGWLYRVTHNHCLMMLRKRQVSRRQEQELKRETMNGYFSPSPDTSIRIPKEQLHAAISQLNTEQKICINLFYLQDKCYREIAGQTGYTLHQVKSYIQNGKRNLKILLEKKHEQPT